MDLVERGMAVMKLEVQIITDADSGQAEAMQGAAKLERHSLLTERMAGEKWARGGRSVTCTVHIMTGNVSWGEHNEPRFLGIPSLTLQSSWSRQSGSSLTSKPAVLLL